MVAEEQPQLAQLVQRGRLARPEQRALPARQGQQDQQDRLGVVGLVVD